MDSPVARLLPRPGDFLTLEASFLLFVYAGRVKTLKILQIVPVDITLLFLITTMVLIILELVFGRLAPPPFRCSVVAMFLFNGLVLLSLFWSSMEPPNLEKAQNYLLLTAPSFVVACMLAQDRTRCERFVRLIAFLSFLILARFAWYQYILGEQVGSPSDKGFSYQDSYAEFADHALMLFLICLCLAVYGPRSSTGLALVGTSVSLFALTTIGHRGSFAIALIMIPILWIGLFFRTERRQQTATRLLLIIAILVTVATSVFAVVGQEDSHADEFRTLQRYGSQLEGTDTRSMEARSLARDAALEMWLEKPLVGWGIGEFEVYDSDMKNPHNLPLELLMETGIAGLVLFGSVAVSATLAAFALLRHSRAWFVPPLALMVLANLISQLTVEGALGDDRILFMYLGLVIGCQAYHARTRLVEVSPPHVRGLVTGGSR